MRLSELKNFKSLFNNFNINELNELCEEIRTFLNNTLNKKGGHIASNLGVVELTVALLSFFNLDESIILFDTGHQSYVYKMLTNRLKLFDKLYEFKGLSNFQEISESQYDWISNGHSGTALAYASAYSFLNAKKNIISIIGDAAFCGSYTTSSLLNLIKSPNKTITIINDNDQSIGNYDIKIKDLKSYSESLGYNYLYCDNGNDLLKIFKILKHASSIDNHVIIHIKTIKGLNYDKKFELSFNHTIKEDVSKSYQILVANQIEQVFDKDSILICPAMLNSSCFSNLKTNWPKNVFDCGINEEVCALMASGFAKLNKKVYISVYSTFFQRMFDQLIHDIVRNNWNITFLIDRAGLNYSGGVSHHGIYDVGVANLFNNSLIYQPFLKKDILKIKDLVSNNNNLLFIRYEKANVCDIDLDFDNNEMWIELIYNKNNKKTLITYGTQLEEFYYAIKNNNLNINLVNARYVNHIDKIIIAKHQKNNLFIYEQIINDNNLAYKIKREFKDINVKNFYIKNPIIGHGKKNDVLQELGLDTKFVLNFINKN
ncbi:1-deoxy-D-xylulose-5-phosphate synthase [Spiroplasma gladiatoris]|uniref:1-deoxy-D-xylulose-5-phosphate synthase n=1 Tax=Spiroplasma gladiatoris TaxID=2143 RepID=A0A4P7AHL8_9MOLU|nr:1-deoxy-D-xylulose-5-phosphate synthase N-terminal domain-containing protein [Spiroplasma gladiatoris]QBQ07707.1 1-deoxy-D-xylulose-5-phosphate synthase [Spiroplasma gladiatoris]